MLMNVYELEEYGKEKGFDSAEFFMISPRPMRGRFLDAYMGLVQIPDIGERFILLNELVKQIGFDNLKFIGLESE